VATRWLNQDEQRTWRCYLEATRLLWDRLEAQLQRDAGMPVSYYQVLVHLSEAPGHALRMSELAQSCGSSRSRLSHAMGRLEAAGWAERRSSPTDGRVEVAVLTGQGLSAIEAAAPGHVGAVRESLFDALSPGQVRQLRRICQQVIDGLQAQVGTPTARPRRNSGAPPGRQPRNGRWLGVTACTLFPPVFL
jgi:DNA-binding MarR family transcriptional regulator